MGRLKILREIGRYFAPCATISTVRPSVNAILQTGGKLTTIIILVGIFALGEPVVSTATTVTFRGPSIFVLGDLVDARVSRPAIGFRRRLRRWVRAGRRCRKTDRSTGGICW